MHVVPSSSSIKIERFAFESCMRGYHVYKDIWEASVGEELPCQRENGNHADPFAVVSWPQVAKESRSRELQ